MYWYTFHIVLDDNGADLHTYYRCYGDSDNDAACVVRKECGNRLLFMEIIKKVK